MALVNEHFLKLPGSYLFSDIAKKVNSFKITHPKQDVIRLGIGDVTRPLPPACIEAMHNAVDEMADAKTFRGYGPEQGYDFLIEAILKNDFAPRGVHLSPAEIFINDGAKSDTGSIGELLRWDNSMAITDPVYPVYVDSNIMCGRAGVLEEGGTWSNVTYLPCTEENGFVPELPKHRVDLIYLCYPNNPTGAIMTRADLEALAEVVREHEIMVVSDEIYSELTYGGEHVSFASLPGMWDYTLTINGFSKSFAMTGWRVGYICGPAEMIAVMNKIHQYGILCAPRQGQVAAVEALRVGRENGYEDVQHMRESYDRRRRLMVDGLRKMGLHCFEPRGAFYVFPSIKSTGLTSEEFCERLLQEQHVACVPGTAFGPCGEGHIRCSYATAVDKLTIALEKMEVFLRGL